MFSASLDSTIVQWSSSFEPYFTIEVYCMIPMYPRLLTRITNNDYQQKSANQDY